MARKIINRTSPGTVDIFGADDLNYVNRLLTGVDQSGTDPVDINTTWKFRTSKLQLANTANTFKYTVVPSAITADRSLTIPLLTGNDTVVTTGTGLTTGQTLTNKTMDYNSNTFLNFPSGGLQRPDTNPQIGGYFGGEDTALMGFCQGASLGTPAGTDGQVYFLNNTDGRYVQFTSNAGGTAAAGNQAGQSLGSDGIGGVTRGLTFRFKIKFRMPSATSVRYYIGLKGTGSDITGDTPVTTTDGFFIFYSTTVSSTQVYLEHNDTTSPSTRDNLDTKDADIHTFEVIGNSTNMRYWWDGVGPTTVTTDIPSTTDVLYPVVWVESSSTGADDLDLWYWYLETPYAG